MSVDVSVYGSDFFFIFNSAACSEGVWKITGFVGVPAEETSDSGAATSETTTSETAEGVFSGKKEELV